MSRKDISIAVIDIVHEMNDSRIDTVERLRNLMNQRNNWIVL